MEFDHVLRIIGEFGPHQRRLYALLNLSLIPAAFQLLLQVFVGAEPNWICLNSLSNETCPRNKSHCSEVQYTSEFTSIVTEVRSVLIFIFNLYSIIFFLHCTECSINQHFGSDKTFNEPILCMNDKAFLTSFCVTCIDFFRVKCFPSCGFSHHIS